MKKHWLRIAGIVVAVIIVLLILLPFLVDVNSFRPKIESEASSALGRRVTLGHLSLSILSGGISADDIAIADDPAFSQAPFITAKSLKIGVEMMPLLFSKDLKVTDILLEKPQIVLLKAADGRWNFSSLSAASGKKAQSSSSPTNLSVGKLEVNDGKLVIGKVNSSASHVYDNFHAEVTGLSPTSSFPFKLTTELPGGGDADFSGKAGPINQADAAKTPFDAVAKVQNLDIGAMGVMDPASGIAGLANFDGTLNSNGSTAKAAGTFTGTKMKFSPRGTPSPKAIIIRHLVNIDLDKQSGTITQGDISVGGAQVHLTGDFQDQGDILVVQLKLDGPNMPVDELQAMLPSFGVMLPPGSRLKGGTLSANLGITGPTDKLVITGPLKLSNTSLVGFNMGSKLGALSSFTGKSVSNPDTSIRDLSLFATVTTTGTRADNINLEVPAIGVITGAGTVSPAGALNFKMVARLNGGMAGGLTKMAGVNIGNTGIPFAISGTTSDPHFTPEVGGIAGSVAAGALKGVVSGKLPAGVLGGLLGKK